MSRDLKRTLLGSLAAVLFLGCAVDQPAHEITLWEDDHSRSSKLENVNAGWYRTNEALFVEVTGKRGVRGGWPLEAMFRFRTNDVDDQLRTGLTECDGVVFWNDHVFPFRWRGKSRGGLTVHWLDGSILRLKGSTTALLVDPDHSPGESRSVTLDMSVHATERELRHSIIYASRLAEYSSAVAEWRQQVAEAINNSTVH